MDTEVLILLIGPGGIPFYLGLVFFIIGLRKKIITRNWVRTTGIIVKKEKTITINLGTIFNGKINSGPDEAPSVQYEVEGKTYVHTSKMKQTPGFRPGTNVDVLYDPTEPEKAVIDSFIQRGSFFLAGGIFFLVIGIIIITIFLISYFNSL